MKQKISKISLGVLLLIFGFFLTKECQANAITDSLCCPLGIAACCSGTPTPPETNPNSCECSKDTPFSGGSAWMNSRYYCTTSVSFSKISFGVK